MKVKFAKNYLSYKAGQEVEIEDADVASDIVAKGYAEEVKAEAGDVASIVAELKKEVTAVAEEVAAKAAKETVAGIKKGFASISVRDRVDDDPKKGFKHFGDFLMNVKAAAKGDGEASTRLKATGSSVGTDADGGYAVPDVWAQEIYNDIVASDSLFNRVRQIPMSGPGSTLKIPADNTVTIGSNGLVAQQKTRAQDGSSITATKIQMRELSIDVNRLVILAPLTDDLLADAIALQSYVMDVAKRELSYRLDDNVLQGGTVCTGIVGHAGTLTLNREAAGDVKFKDLTDMWSRRYGRSGSFVWIINPEVETHLMNASDAAGRNLYFAPGTLPNNPNGVLFGCPVLVSDNASTIGTTGDVTLASLENYLAVTKGGVDFATSPHVYFDTAEQAFRWTQRVGGRPARDAVITPATGRGSKTRSPFVTLGSGASVGD